MVDDKLASDFSFPASPGDYFPPIMGDPGEEEAQQQTGLIVPHVVHAFNDNNSSLVAIATTTELKILNTEIPAGQMEDGDVYSLRITGESFNNTGAGQTLTLRFYYDDVVELATAARTMDSSAIPRKWWIQIDIAARIRPTVPGAVQISGMALATATGVSESWSAFGSSESSIGSAGAAATKTGPIHLDFSAQLGTSSVNAYFQVDGWHLLRFPHKH